MAKKRSIRWGDIANSKVGLANSQKISELWPSKKEGKRKNKYNNKITIVDGIKFHSEGESKRYTQLKRYEQLGRIKNLELQKKYTLVPRIKKQDGSINEPLVYIADFFYFNVITQKEVTEDFKGRRTQGYIDKAKQMKNIYDIEVYETTKKHIEKDVL